MPFFIDFFQKICDNICIKERGALVERFDKKTMKIVGRVALFLGTILLLYLMFKFAVYFMPFLIAGIIAIIIEPVIKFFMNKLKMSRRVSAIIVVGVTIILLGVAILWGGTSLIREILKLSSNLGPAISDAIAMVQSYIGDLSVQFNDIPEQVVTGVQNSLIDFLSNVGGFLSDWAKKILNILLSVPAIIINVVITILALIFFTKDRIYVIDLMEHHFPKSWMKKFAEVSTEFFSTLGGYIRVYFKIILITFAELYLAFNIYNVIGFDIKYPFLLAAVISVIDILPVLGVGTVLNPWWAYLFITGQWQFGLAVLITQAVIFVVRQFIEPKLVSKQFGIHPIITLLAMYAGYRAAGVFGLILGPIALMILRCVFAKHIEKGIFKDLFDEN